MTVDTQKLRELLDAFGDAAQVHGWESDQGSAADAHAAATDYANRATDLWRAIAAVVAENESLRAQLNQTASMLQSACLVINDSEARAVALQQVKDAHAVLNARAPQGTEK